METHKMIANYWCEKNQLIDTGILGAYAKGLLNPFSNDVGKISKRLEGIKNQMNSSTNIKLIFEERIEADIFNEVILVFTLNSNETKANRILTRIAEWFSWEYYMPSGLDSSESISSLLNEKISNTGLLNYRPQVNITSLIEKRVKRQFRKQIKHSCYHVIL